MADPARLAAIDVGTNTVRCIVVEPTADHDFRVLDDERAMVRLGEGLAAAGEISPAAWDRARAALERMGKIAAGLGARAVEAVATSAVREASNGRAFVDAMARDTGIRIRVITGDEEARLALLSARHHFDLRGGRPAMVDIGGGSTEVVLATGEHVEALCSLDLGAVVLTERFLPRDPPSDKARDRLARHVRKKLRRAVPGRSGSHGVLVGSGGTVSAIGTMTMALRGERFHSVHGYEVLRSEVVHLLAMLARKSVRERRSVPGLRPERADIIVAGVTVVDRLMDHLDVNVLKVNGRGVREGLILQALRDHGLVAGPAGPRDRRGSVEALARSCRADLGHARHVRFLALALFDALAGPFGLPARDRDLLEAAAVLHDVGYFIGYARHHKHAYHLIRHADLFDFSPRERELVATIARYHRKALPRKKHEGYRLLGEDDRARVRRLGGLLRLADGLDRRRAGCVTGLSCTLEGKELRVTLQGEGDLSVERHSGRVKGDLFEHAFGLRLVVEEAGPVVIPPPGGAGPPPSGRTGSGAP